MATITLKIIDAEADDVAKGWKTFVFRNDSLAIKQGDQILFRVVFKGKQRPHIIEKQRFVCTYVDKDAPIDKGFQVIGVRRTK